jgi:hypothetical protein
VSIANYLCMGGRLIELGNCWGLKPQAVSASLVHELAAPAKHGSRAVSRCARAGQASAIVVPHPRGADAPKPLLPRRGKES